MTNTPTAPIVPDHVRAAIHAGHVAQVVIFCDYCGVEHRADYIGETHEDRFAAARAYLAAERDWEITALTDLCPDCKAPDVLTAEPGPEVNSIWDKDGDEWVRTAAGWSALTSWRSPNEDADPSTWAAMAVSPWAPFTTRRPS